MADGIADKDEVIDDTRLERVQRLLDAAVAVLQMKPAAAAGVVDAPGPDGKETVKGKDDA